MKQSLYAAVLTSIEALLQVPGTQLQLIEPTLRQLFADLKKANLIIPADLDSLIEGAAVAHFEDRAMLKDCFTPGDDEPPFDVVDWMNDIPEKPHFTKEDKEEFYRMNYYEMYGCYPDEPKAQKAMTNMLRDMFPEDELPF